MNTRVLLNAAILSLVQFGLCATAAHAESNYFKLSPYAWLAGPDSSASIDPGPAVQAGAFSCPASIFKSVPAQANEDHHRQASEFTEVYGEAYGPLYIGDFDRLGR